MSNQPNEAAQRYSPCREKSETLVGGVVTTMKPNDQGNWVRYSLLRNAEAEISSLRSALANAEKDRAASARDWEAALSAHDRRVEELNQALAKLAEAEKEHDESRAAQRSVICELQQAMAEVFRHLGPPTNRYTPWREQVIEAINDLRSERDAALAKLAEAERDCAGYKERIHELSDELGACDREQEPKRDDSRCARCGWTLRKKASDGCVRGNCSYRPEPPLARHQFYDAERWDQEAAALGGKGGGG